MLEIRLRQMMLSDLDGVMLIEPDAFGSHHWSRQSFINELNNPCGHYFVAISRPEGRLVGYSGFWLIGDEAHITTLAVAPELRRQYIGERLFIYDLGQARAEGANWMTLEVRVSNERAQQLYFKYGFRSLGLRRHYYQDNGEDAMVLWTENINAPEFKRLVEQRMAELEAKLSALTAPGAGVGEAGGSALDNGPQMEV